MPDDPIISTRDKPGEYDGLVSAKANEPIFVIQGGDPLGPDVVLAWAAAARNAGLAETDQAKADVLLRKATNAEQVAWRMRSYQAGHVESEGARAHYSDDGPSEAGTPDARAVRIRVADRLVAMSADATALVEKLESVDSPPGTETLRQAVTEIGEAAKLIEPRVGRERT